MFLQNVKTTILTFNQLKMIYIISDIFIKTVGKLIN